MAFVLLIHSETLGVKVNNPTCFLKCSDWNTLNCYILYINYPILAGYFPNRVVPRMSSHCYKLFDLFSLDFSHKTVVLEQRTLYCCHKISREDVTSLLQVQ